MRLRGVSVAAIFFTVALGMACAPAIMGPTMNTAYESKLENLLPPDLEQYINTATLDSIADPSILMSEDAMEKLRNEKTNLEELIRTLPFSSIYQFRDLQKAHSERRQSL